MNKDATLYRHIHRMFDHPLVFNLNQIILDGGKKRQIRRFLADVPYESVLDIGCGTGNWVSLARGRYLGIDTSPTFIEACRQQYPDDPNIQFLQADATTVSLDEQYDLAMLISVLHHLSDVEAERLFSWMARQARYLFILDLYPIPSNPVSRWLYGMDRGDYIREPEDQKTVILRHPNLELHKENDYYAPNRLYRHTLFLFESTARGPGLQ